MDQKILCYCEFLATVVSTGVGKLGVGEKPRAQDPLTKLERTGSLPPPNPVDSKVMVVVSGESCLWAVLFISEGPC